MSDINSNELNKAMLTAKLSGNEMKVILAYVDKGGWKATAKVFLPESVKEEYGLSDSTVKRARKRLVELGWLIPTGEKSQWGCDKYLVRIPCQQGRSKRPEGSVKMTPGVGQNDLGGRSIRPTEVTKEVTKGSNVGSNKDYSSGKPSSSTLSSSKDKDDSLEEQVGAPRLPNSPYSEESSLIDLNGPIGPDSPYGQVAQSRVGQNEPPLEPLDWDTPPVRFRDRVIA